jgi:hypothetical protein
MARGIRLLEKSNYFFENRTGGLPAFSMVLEEIKNVFRSVITWWNEGLP